MKYPYLLISLSLLHFGCDDNPKPKDTSVPIDTADTQDTGETQDTDTGDTQDTGDTDTGDTQDTTDTQDTGSVDTADTGDTDTGDTGPGVNAVADFSLPDINPSSPTVGQNISPRDYLQQISGWYFIKST